MIFTLPPPYVLIIMVDIFKIFQDFSFRLYADTVKMKSEHIPEILGDQMTTGQK